jgi:hypothetical protein
MSGKYSRIVIPGMSVGGAIITFQANIANTITFCFPVVCSSESYNSGFKVIKDSAETFPLNLVLMSPSALLNFLQH